MANKLYLKYQVSPCRRQDITSFLEQWHYSKSINGVVTDYCFKLEHEGKIIGAMVFGQLAMASQWKKYGKTESDVTELRRLACIDDTEKNTESFFIGKCLRWLQLNTEIKTVVSYADPEYGHSGVIYKASNFVLNGKSADGKVIMWGNKKYHDKTIRTMYKGKLKPYAKRVKDALEDGLAYYKKTKGKNVYVYNLKPVDN